MLVFGTFDVSERAISVLGDSPALVLWMLLTKSGLRAGGVLSPHVSVKKYTLISNAAPPPSVHCFP